MTTPPILFVPTALQPSVRPILDMKRYSQDNIVVRARYLNLKILPATIIGNLADNAVVYGLLTELRDMGITLVALTRRPQNGCQLSSCRISLGDG